MTYKYEDVYKSTLDYFNGDDLATNVWITKYCKSELNEDGVTVYYEKTPDDMFHRIASEISRAGMKYDNPLSENEVYELIKDYKYILFAGRPMAGIGVDDAVSISNCFVVGKPGQDSYGTIATIDQEIMQLSKRGGGVGTDLSDYRPNGAKVRNAARTSSGPVDICATRFSNTIREVGQCIDGESFVITEKRGMIKIKDVTTNDKVWTHKGFVQVNNVINKGIKNTNTVKTKFGFNINVTDDHIMISCDEKGLREEYMSNLKIGDNIVLLNGVNNKNKEYVTLTNNFNPSKRPIINQCGVVGEMIHNKYKECKVPNFIDEEFAYFLGVLMGDGHTDKKNNEISISCNSKDIEEINKLVKIINDKFGFEPIIKDCGTYIVLRINRAEIVSFLEENGINKPNTEYLRIPQKIYESKSSVQCSFLSGLIDSDGCNKKGKGGYQITTVNKDFANDIQLLYSLNGINSKIHIYTPKNVNWKTKYTISVVGLYAQKMLVSLLYESVKVNSYPFVAKRDIFLTPFTRESLGCKRIENGIRLNGNYISTHNLMDLKNKGVYKDEILIKDTISSIEQYKEVEVYDIVLDDVNMFWCNGIYVHNCGRRGALMLSMDINHPSAEEFIDAKMEDGKITGANISVKLYDDWMKSALGIDCEMDIEKNRLWKKIIHNATTKAEPGVLFWDTVIKESVADCYSLNGYKSTSCNPCAELVLCPDDSCRLMSLNLYSYVDNPFTKKASFNFDKFIKHAKTSIKIMDNMIELELEKIDKILAKIDSDPESDDIKLVEKNLWTRIRKKCKEGRRSGIGITAMGDMLAALGIKYGTPKATLFTQEVQRALALSVYIGSCDLVQKDNRPVFGCFDYNLERNNPFLNRLAKYYECNDSCCDDELLNLLSKEFANKWKDGRRNIACLTIAPTGSISTQTQTTSGIEPVFMISYRRRRKIDKNSGIKPDFIDKTGDAFIEFNVVHHKFIEWYRIHRNTNLNNMDNEMTFNEAKTFLEGLSTDKLNDIIKQSPYFGATAMDCDWHERINMQGAIQKYNCHAISCTVNLPKGTSEEVVEDVYKTAWLSGCKGCTIYVDGCRDGVLITKDKDKKCECNKFMETVSPKRPKKLPCQIVRFSNKGTKWIAAVGLYEGKPYEIFTGLAEKLDIPTNAKDIFIVRNKVNKEVFDEDTETYKTIKVSRYDIEYVNDNGEIVLIEGLSTTFKPEYWNYAKLISGLFRHGMPAHYVVKVVEGLDFKDEGINTWKNGIIRALKPFMKDEKTGDKCPSCGADLWRVSGCIQCPDCGWSKCS